MTDKEVSIALKIHNDGDISQCKDCPYFGDYEHCTDRLLRDAYSYTKKLVAKNKALNDKITEDVKSI